MSLGIISKEQYKKVAQNDGVTLLNELAAPGTKDYTNKFTYIDNISFTSAAINFAKEYTVEEDGVYLVRVKCTMVDGTEWPIQSGNIIPNEAALYINGDKFDQVSSYYNWQWGYIQFVLPLKAGTVIKATYRCDKNTPQSYQPNMYRCGFWVDKLGN